MRTECLKQLWEDTRETRTLGTRDTGLELQASHVLECTLYVLSRVKVRFLRVIHTTQHKSLLQLKRGSFPPHLAPLLPGQVRLLLTR